MARLLLLLVAASVTFGQESRPTTQPVDATSMNAEALRLVEAKKLDEALVMIERARALLPQDPVIATNHARIITRRAQVVFERAEFLLAQEELERALKIAPKEHLTRVQLAIVLRTQGDLSGARREVQQVLEAEPACAQGFEELARIAYEEEDLAGALEALMTALKLDPTREKALAEFKEKLERESKIEGGLHRSVRGQFVVKYDDQAFKDIGEVVLGFLEDAEGIARQTFAVVPTRRITVVLYSHGDFTNTTGAHAWAGGLFDGKIRLPVRNFTLTRDSIRRTIAHEYMHLVVREISRKCPTWLNEGLAQLAEGKSLLNARETLRGAEVRAFSSLPSSWMGIADGKAVAEMYAQSLLFTEFIVRRVGYPGIKDILQRSSGTTPFGTAFTDIVGKSLDDAESEWRAAR